MTNVLKFVQEDLDLPRLSDVPSPLEQRVSPLLLSDATSVCLTGLLSSLWFHTGRTIRLGTEPVKVYRDTTTDVSLSLLSGRLRPCHRRLPSLIGDLSLSGLKFMVETVDVQYTGT